MTYPPHIEALRTEAFGGTLQNSAKATAAINKLAALAAQAPAPPEPPLTTVRGYAARGALNGAAKNKFEHGLWIEGRKVWALGECIPVAVVPLSPDGGLTEEIKRVAHRVFWDENHTDGLAAALRAVLGVEEGR